MLRRQGTPMRAHLQLPDARFVWAPRPGLRDRRPGRQQAAGVAARRRSSSSNSSSSSSSSSTTTTTTTSNNNNHSSSRRIIDITIDINRHAAERRAALARGAGLSGRRALHAGGAGELSLVLV